MGEKVERLQLLWKLQEENHIDLFFSDESGFQLVPNLPYGWQAKGEYSRLFPRKGKKLSIFALLSTHNRLVSYPTVQNTNAAFIIECLEDFIKKIHKPTVIIMDNAPIHRAKIMMAKRKEWEDRGLFIFFLPKYSPHLNRIEILWRKMKYEWLKPKNYKSWTTLTNAVKHILATFGTAKFTIKFSKPYYIL